jgi:predicted N-acetyltransferase YhbS
MTAPGITIAPADMKGSVHVSVGARHLGTVTEHRHGGWFTMGCVLGPLAVRHDDQADAIAALVLHQLSGARAVA